MSDLLILTALILNVIGVSLLVWRPPRSDGAANHGGRSQPPSLPLRTVGMALIASAFALVLVGQLEATLAFWYWCVWTHMRRPRASQESGLPCGESRRDPCSIATIPPSASTVGVESDGRGGPAVRRA